MFGLDLKKVSVMKMDKDGRKHWMESTKNMIVLCLGILIRCISYIGK